MTSTTTPLRVAFDSFTGEPGLDAAVSAALLEAVGAGEEPETLRLYRPGHVVAFGRQDLAASGYPEAAAAARRLGYDAVERLAGGRAAVFTPGTVAFGWAIPDPDPRTSTEQRFRSISELIRDTLIGLGVDARVGEVPGEYCPGRFSVNAGGTLKLMGVGQRLKRHAAHVGGVLVVDDPDAINAVLDPVYAALDLDWRPAATGAVADVVAGATVESAIAALLDLLRSQRPIEEGSISEGVALRGRHLAPQHLSPR